MKLKQLQSLLQDVDDFIAPVQNLEQYITGPHIAAGIILEIDKYEDLANSTIMDLGCGTGMLSIACALLDCPLVLGVDIDPAALAQAQKNIDTFPALPVELLQADVCQLGRQHGQRTQGSGAESPSLADADSFVPFISLPVVDCVIMNPPFGSWQKGADSIFLAGAVQVATSSVYSLHKRSTRSHIARLVKGMLGAQSAQVIAELRYDLPATYKHHTKKSKDVEVDLWRIVKVGATQPTG